MYEHFEEIDHPEDYREDNEFDKYDFENNDNDTKESDSVPKSVYMMDIKEKYLIIKAKDE